jgi:membrane-associated phospholipid phosphatase
MQNNIRIFIFVLFTSSLISAQNNFSLAPIKSNKPGVFANLQSDFSSALGVGWDLLKSPLSYDKNDFILSGLIIGATALSFSIDNPVRNSIRSTRSNSMDRFTNIGEKFGNPKYGSWLSGILYVGGHIVGDKELRLTGMMLAETIFLNGLVTQVLKSSFGRARPFLNEGNGEIDFLEFEFEDESNSLPSGHTSTAFAIATVLSQRIDNFYASAAFYSLASLTAFQRIYADKHWISDTILGAAIGTLVGLQVVKLHAERDEANSSNIKIDILPYYQSGSVGIGASVNF